MEQIFFYDIPIDINKDPGVLAAHTPYFKSLTSELAISNVLSNQGHICIKANQEGFNQMLKNFGQIFATKPLSITVFIDDVVSMAEIIQEYFKIVSAAGGLVSKGDKILMIYRLDKWDLPKGKVELGEDAITAAIREVAEECGVEAIPTKKLGVTWHNYKQGGIDILKETTWYAMDCVQDTDMKPQGAEGITQVAWLDPNELQSALSNSYKSIEYVLDLHYYDFGFINKRVFY